MNNNYLLMDDFLNTIKELAISNPEKIITDNVIYSILLRYNIPSEQKPLQNIKGIFKEFYKRYQNNENIKVFEIPNFNFLILSNGEINGNEIKLYLPYDAEHITLAGEKIFDFLAKENIVHQSKIAIFVRNDDFVIRVNTLEDANKIVDFVKNDVYLKSNLLNVNPFLPNQDGIGMAMDNSYSFNSILSDIISDLVNKLKKENRLNDLNVTTLNAFIREEKDLIDDLDKKDIYDLLAKTTRQDFQVSEFYQHAKHKLLDDYVDHNIRIVDAEYYLEKALKINEKYYPGLGASALIRYSKGDILGFTRNENARNILEKHVSFQKVEPLILDYLARNGITYKNKEDIYSLYVNSALNLAENVEKSESIAESEKVEKPGNVVESEKTNLPAIYYLEKAVKLTELHHPFLGIIAVKQFALGNPLGFTRSAGARELVVNNYKPEMIKPLIIGYLMRRGIKFNDESEIYELYVHDIIKYDQKNDINLLNLTTTVIDALTSAYLHTCDVYGEAQGQAALLNLLNKNSLRYFTKKFDARTELKNILIGKNVKLCLQEFLGEDYFNADNETIVQGFIERVNRHHGLF